MMEKIRGYKMTCDRCGKEEYVEHSRVYLLDVLDSYVWSKVKDYDLCPECSKKLNGLIDDFLDNGETA